MKIHGSHFRFTPGKRTPEAPQTITVKPKTNKTAPPNWEPDRATQLLHAALVFGAAGSQVRKNARRKKKPNKETTISRSTFYEYINTHVHVHMYIYISIYIYINVYIYMYIYNVLLVCICACVHAHIYIYTYIYICFSFLYFCSFSVLLAARGT